MRECEAVSRFANLADKPKTEIRDHRPEVIANGRQEPGTAAPVIVPPAPSRIGRKAIAAYFSPEMSLALHFCARKQGRSLQALMSEAFDDVLRKYGESPIGG